MGKGKREERDKGKGKRKEYKGKGRKGERKGTLYIALTNKYHLAKLVLLFNNLF